ncbi:MAG: hypothetical protein HRU05_05760 [Oceanospirillaceae bacterium]|nr:hypothetical protein [Oceanospirillaceae bacterium]
MKKDATSTHLSIERELTGDLARAGAVAGNWHTGSPIYLSIKTTGSDQFSQVIEIAILDTDQSVLFHSQIKPSIEIDADVERSQGINASALQDRPSWPQVLDRIIPLMRQRNVIMFNALYQTRVLKQSCLAYNLSLDWLDGLAVNCSMYLAANAYGTNNRYGTISIEYAMKKAGIAGYSERSSTVAGCYAQAKMLHLMALYTEQLRLQVAFKMSA